MADKELFNGNNRTEINDDEVIAFATPGQEGSENIRWDAFKTIWRGLVVFLTGDQTIGGNKTFTGEVRGKTPTSDPEFATKGYVDSLNATSSWTIIESSSNVSPAVVGSLYKMDASSAPRTVSFPDPTVELDGKQIAVSLRIDTHKVTITTVGGVAGAIAGYDSEVLPRISGTAIYQCDGTKWCRILDTRNMRSRVRVDGDRDFTTDGFEHDVIYELYGNNNILLPPPVNFNGDFVSEAAFVKKDAGIATFTRSDSGLIGSLTTQTISTVEKGFTLSEGDNKYSIVQDSRPSSSSLIGLQFYRLITESDIVGYNKLVRSKDDPDYNPITQEVPTAGISSEIASIFLKYVCNAEDLPDIVDATTVTFTVSTRKTLSVQANVTAYYVLRKRDELGIETFIAQSGDFTIADTFYEQRNINMEFPQSSFAETDRLVLEVWLAKTSGSGTPTLTTKFEGLEDGADPARFELRVNASSIDHNLLTGRDAFVCHPDKSIEVTATNFTESNVKEVFENSIEPEEKTTIADTDVLCGYEAGDPAPPKYWFWSDIKSFLLTWIQGGGVTASDIDYTTQNTIAEQLDLQGAGLGSHETRITSLELDRKTLVLTGVNADFTHVNFFPEGYKIVEYTAENTTANASSSPYFGTSGTDLYFIAPAQLEAANTLTVGVGSPFSTGIKDGVNYQAFDYTPAFTSSNNRDLDIFATAWNNSEYTLTFVLQKI